MDLVLDLYDDPTAEILCRRLNGVLPSKLASATLLSQEELQKLPDRLFGLVATYEGSALRKYAMHDAPHLATSIAYFMETYEKLPELMRQKVAANLVNACAWYDASPPEELVKIALVGTLTAGLGLMAVPDKLRQEKAKSQNNMQAFRAAQASGTKLASGRTVEISAEEEQRIARGEDSAGHAWQELERMFSGDLSSQNQAFNSTYPDPFVGKVANTSGTELAVQGALSNDPRGATPARKMAVSPKTSSWKHAGDLTGHKIPAIRKVAAATHYALPQVKQYPIDTAEQVKKAGAYFETYAAEFSATDRRIFALEVMQRSADLGVKLAGKISNYGGTVYGDYIFPELQGRVNAFEGTAKQAAYQVLLEKRASIPPFVMVELLKQADAETGVDGSYGRVVTGFREPVVAVYGKTAGDGNAEFGAMFTWSHAGHHVSEDTLNLYSIQTPELDQVFGPGFSLKFQRDPVRAFQSLPDAEKVILSRLANSEASRTP